MGDSFSPNVNNSMSEIMASLTKNLPAYMQVVNEQVAPTEAAKLAAAQQVSPAYNQLLVDLYSKYGPEMAAAGAATDRIAKTANVETTADLLNRYGGQLGAAASAAENAASPDVAKVRSAAGNKLTELLGSYNLNAPNIEAERLINQENVRSGNAMAPANATNTVANALSFGDEAMKRQDALSRALSVATAYIPAAKSNFDVGSVVTGTPSVNSGTAQFAGVKNPGQEAYNAGNAGLGSATQMRSEQNQADIANYQQGVDMYSKLVPDSSSL